MIIKMGKKGDSSWVSLKNIKPVLDAQIQIIEEIKPDYVINDYSFTAHLAAEFSNIPCVSLINGLFSKNLAIDFLKIYSFFVKTMQHNKIDLAMVRSINEIAHVLGKKTIAKFVENKEILELLQNLDVDFVQGNYLGEPKQICYAEEY